MTTLEQEEIIHAFNQGEVVQFIAVEYEDDKWEELTAPDHEFDFCTYLYRLAGKKEEPTPWRDPTDIPEFTTMWVRRTLNPEDVFLVLGITQNSGSWYLIIDQDSINFAHLLDDDWEYCLESPLAVDTCWNKCYNCGEYVVEIVKEGKDNPTHKKSEKNKARRK